MILNPLALTKPPLLASLRVYFQRIKLVVNKNVYVLFLTSSITCSCLVSTVPSFMRSTNWMSAVPLWCRLISIKTIWPSLSVPVKLRTSWAFLFTNWPNFNWSNSLFLFRRLLHFRTTHKTLKTKKVNANFTTKPRPPAEWNKMNGWKINFVMC